MPGGGSVWGFTATVQRQAYLFESARPRMGSEMGNFQNCKVGVRGHLFTVKSNIGFPGSSELQGVPACQVEALYGVSQRRCRGRHTFLGVLGPGWEERRSAVKGAR